MGQNGKVKINAFLFVSLYTRVLPQHLCVGYVWELWLQDKLTTQYEGHPIKNETFAIAQWINMLDLWNRIQS